jgi:D-3-phosphoglycerate dehydrogenase
MVGAVGTLMGEYGVNISFMNVGRHEKRGTALMVLALDETLTPEQIARVKEIPDILGVKLARL